MIAGLKYTPALEKWVTWGGGALFLACISLFAYTSNYYLLAIPFAVPVLALAIFNWKAFYWLFLLCIPLSSPVFFLHDSISTTFPDEQFMWMFFIMFIVLVAANYKILPEWFLRHPLTLVLILQFTWLLGAVGVFQDFVLSFKYMLAKSWFIISYFIFPVLIFREKKDFVTAFKLFVIPVCLHALFAFTWHYFLHFGFWDSNKVVRPFYRNHVDYSTVLSMVFPLLLVAFQLCKGNKRLRILLFCLIIFFIPAIYVAAARAAMIGIMFSLVIAFAVRKKLVQWVLPLFFVFITSIIVFMVKDDKYLDYRPNYKYTFTQVSFTDLITATFRGTDMSSRERFYRWIASARMSMEHPLVGVGPNNFYTHYKGHAVTLFKTYVQRNEEKSTTHNYFIFMLVEQGWPAMILYGILMMAIFSNAQRIYHQSRDPFFKKVTMGLVMLAAVGFVNNFFSELIETDKVGALFFIPIALLIVIDHKNKKALKTAPPASNEDLTA